MFGASPSFLMSVLNSRRAEWLAASSLVLGGCMRIYPDPELPDIELSWFDDDCREGTSDIAVTLSGVDEPSQLDATVPCSDLRVTFKDVARQQYRLEAALLNDDGTIFSRFRDQIDLRDGSDKRVPLYLGGGAYFRVAWTFDMDATCASLGANGIAIDLVPSDFPLMTRCDATPFLGLIGSGTFSVRLRALANWTTVAVSPQLDDVVVAPPAFTDLGTLTLSPCGTACPDSP